MSQPECSKALEDAKAFIRKELQKVVTKDDPQRYYLAKEKVSTAKCWNTFQHVMDVDTKQRLLLGDYNFVACQDCLTVYTFSSKSGTSTLNRHACTMPIAGDTTQAGSIRAFLGATAKVKTSDKVKVIKALAKMAACDLAPFSQVEDAGFREFASVMLNIGVTLNKPALIDDLLPTRNTVTSHVIQDATKIRDILRTVCEKHFQSQVAAAFTTDLWTDAIKKRSFMSITIHNIDASFNLYARTLQVKIFHAQSHTAGKILEAFQQCLKDFGCNEPDLCTVVSDSGSNMSAANGIRKYFQWLPCCDHKIATALTTVLNKTTTTESGVKSAPFYRFEDEAPEVFDLIESCKALVTYFKQANLQDLLTSTLKQENATRWNSLLRLLQSIVKVFDELYPILAAKNKQFLLAKIDKPLLDELEQFLGRFQEATLKLEQFKAPTLHLVVFERFSLLSSCKPSEQSSATSRSSSDSKSLITLKRIIMEFGLSKWELHMIHIAAAYLDPRQKDRLSKFDITEIQLTAAKQELELIMMKVGPDPNDKESENQTKKPAPIEERPSKKKRSSSIQDMISLCASSSESEGDEDDIEARPTPLSDCVKMEVLKYERLKLSKATKRDPSFNLLTWWKEKSVTEELPILSRAARSVLCIPASSSMSECNFSDAGNTITKKRNALKPARVDDLLVVRSNVDLL